MDTRVFFLQQKIQRCRLIFNQKLLIIPDLPPWVIHLALEEAECDLQQASPTESQPQENYYILEILEMQHLKTPNWEITKVNLKW